MTRDQHLEFCNRCTNRKFDGNKGVICAITNEIAAFENSCDNYKEDVNVPQPEKPVTIIEEHTLVASLPENVKAILRKQQDPVLGIVGGLSAAILGAIIWAAVTVATNFQIGYMAIGVGLLVGFSVRYFGAGVDQYFGFIGAVLALAGCALGNLLTQVIFAANAEAVAYMDIIRVLNLDLILMIFRESFSPMDILFYGIAAYEGYKFAFRKVDEEVYAAAARGQVLPLPYAQFRLPVAVALYILFAVFGFTMRSSSNGEKINYYPSGQKQSSGLLEDGKQSGQWAFWWESGKPMSKGSFVNGKMDNTWEFYSEEGILYRRSSYKSGVEHGPWSDLYENEKPSSKGNFVNGRKDGEWTFYYEDGTVSQRGNYNLDRAHGDWEYYFANGKPSTTATYEYDEPRGNWTIWNEAGIKITEIDYGTDGNPTIVNSWSPTGKQEVKDGNGTYNDYYFDGNIRESGLVKNRLKTGTWTTFYENGKVDEVGHYSDGMYFIDSKWATDGNLIVKDGEGQFERYGELHVLPGKWKSIGWTSSRGMDYVLSFW